MLLDKSKIFLYIEDYINRFYYYLVLKLLKPTNSCVFLQSQIPKSWFGAIWELISYFNFNFYFNNRIMDLGLSNQHVLITGSAGGIGLRTAELFLQQNCKVTLHYNTQLESLKPLLESHNKDR